MRALICIADTTLHIQPNTLTATTGPGPQLTVTAIDNQSGKEHKIDCGYKELGAALALLMEDQWDNGIILQELYRVAEPMFVDCPKECRFIP